MLNLPVYQMPGSGIWYFHTRFKGQQIKKSLKTRDKAIATLKALELVRAMTIRKFEIDIAKGIFKAEPGEDTRAMNETLANLSSLGVFKSIRTAQEQPEALPPAPHRGTLKKGEGSAGKTSKQGLNLLELVEKLFLLKSHLSQATRQSYKGTVEEFSKFLNKPLVIDVTVSSVTSFQEILATRENTTRTIDNKVAVIRAVFNFAIKQGYYFDKNPAEGRSLQTKKEKAKNGFAIFEPDEIEQVFNSEYFQNQKIKDPNYYWGALLALISGCRSSEITGLEAKNIKTDQVGNYFLSIRESKTSAGIREVPISKTFFELGFDKFKEGKKGQVFKYISRDGKGTGNAIGKKFSRHLELVEVNRDKLVFHSLRKFFNDFLMKNKIPIEARSQIVGHEIDSINVQVYANKLAIEELSEMISPLQNKILQIAKINLPVA